MSADIPLVKGGRLWAENIPAGLYNAVGFGAAGLCECGKVKIVFALKQDVQ